MRLSTMAVLWWDRMNQTNGGGAAVKRRLTMTEQNNSIRPECNCCFPPQQLTVTGQRAFCPITERIYDAAPPPVDFYPGRQKRRGEVAPFAINPAEDRFGQQ